MTDSAALPGDNNESIEPIVPIEPITPLEPDGELHTLLNYFHAALFEPVSTLKKLTAETATRTKELWFEAFLVVVIAGAIMGGVKSQSASQLLFFVTSRILDMLLFWYIASSILVTLSKMMGTRKYTMKEGAAITGIAFAPLVLTGLLGCLAALPQALYMGILSLPFLWMIALLAMAYRIALGISYMKLMLMIMVLPPLLFLVEAFWICSALVMALSLPFRS